MGNSAVACSFSRLIERLFVRILVLNSPTSIQPQLCALLDFEV